MPIQYMAVRRGTPLFRGNRKMPPESGVFYFFTLDHQVAKPDKGTT
jgi:hypothetical protein